MSRMRADLSAVLVASVRYGKALAAFVESAAKNGTQVTQSYACVNGGDIVLVCSSAAAP